MWSVAIAHVLWSDRLSLARLRATHMSNIFFIGSRRTTLRVAKEPNVESPRGPNEIPLEGVCPTNGLFGTDSLTSAAQPGSAAASSSSPASSAVCSAA